MNLFKNMLIDDSLHESVTLNSRLQCFSLSEVANHGDASDCWIIIYDRVYRITDFLDQVRFLNYFDVLSYSKLLFQHPGGKDLLLEYAGKDATLAFRGTGHSETAIKSLKQYEIGELIAQQQIFRKNGMISIQNLPE